MMEVDLKSVLDRWFIGRMEAVHTMLPASVQSYEGHGTRRAVVVPAVNFRAMNGTVIPYPPISGVQVWFPSTSRFSALFDIKKGDTGFLLMSEAAIGNWLDGKAAGTPEDCSRFSLHDAIFIPGLFPWAAIPQTDAPTSGAWFSYEGTSVEFKSSGGLKITGDVEVVGKMRATGEVTAKHSTTPVNLSTHIHPTPAGPSSAPTPGT